jgi:hypothetical protein
MGVLSAPTLVIAEASQVAGEPPLIADFEAGLPGSWFQYGDCGAGSWINHTPMVTDTRPGGVPTTTVLAVDYSSAGWGAGTGQDLSPAQDWSDYDGLSFWFCGSGSGNTFEVILSDNRSDPGSDTSERFEATFVDNFTGWKKVTLMSNRLERSAEQPAGAPDDGLGLTKVWDYGFELPAASSGPFYMDQVRLEVLPRLHVPRPGRLVPTRIPEE